MDLVGVQGHPFLPFLHPRAREVSTRLLTVRRVSASPTAIQVVPVDSVLGWWHKCKHVTLNRITLTGRGDCSLPISRYSCWFHEGRHRLMMPQCSCWTLWQNCGMAPLVKKNCCSSYATPTRSLSSTKPSSTAMTRKAAVSWCQSTYRLCFRRPVI